MPDVKLAQEMNPGSATAHRLRGWLLMVAFRLDESLEATRRAYAVDPLSALTAALYGALLGWTGDYEAAEEHLLKALALHPGYFLTYGPLLDLYVRTGRWEQAIQAGERAASLATLSVESGARGPFYAWILAVREEREQALEVLAGVGDNVPAALFCARAYAVLGEPGRALTWLERHAYWGFPYAPMLRWDPEFDPLRSDPRFQAVVENMERAWGLR